MAAKEFDSSDIKKQEELDDITACCICTEVFTDPKALPCSHTFCMKCLRETGIKANKGPGDEMSCPICRRLFKIPPEGFHELPKNVFIERLIQVSKVSDPSAVAKALCSLCLEVGKEQDGEEIPTADVYCVECKHQLCEECFNEHRKFKLTRNHKLIPINEYESGKNVIHHHAQSVCEIHESNILDVYCVDCQHVVCAICFIEKHKSHEGSHVNKCVDGFRKQIEDNTGAMNDCISHAQKKKAELLHMKEEVQRRVKNIECDIEKRTEKLKQLADRDASCLLQSLCSERQSMLKEIQMEIDEFDAYLSRLDSYNSYCQNIMSKGSASDICRAVSDLSVRASELQQQCDPNIERGIQDFKFCFRQSGLEEFLEEDCSNLIGEIGEEDGSESKKRRKQILLAEWNNEIDKLRKENEALIKESADYNAQIEILKDGLQKTYAAINALQVSNDNLKQELGAEKTTNNLLQVSNDKHKSDYKAYIEKLKKKLETNEVSINKLQVSNDNLKKELDAEKTTNNSLQANNDKLKKELDAKKKTNNSFYAKVKEAIFDYIILFIINTCSCFACIAFIIAYVNVRR